MTKIAVRLADSDADIQAAKVLCREWLDWHWKVYPKDWPIEGNPMDRDKFQLVLDNLASLHARPRGGILIAAVDDQPAGCVMFSEKSTDTAEFNRMFVSENRHGLGLGRALLETMLDQLRADGYARVFFSSATFLTHARAMYQNAGFVDMPHPKDFPDAWKQYAYFMERSLA